MDGYAGIVCEIEVNKRTGKMRVTRVVVSHDVGIIINPTGLKAQIEGNVVHGVSRALKEEVVLNGKTSKSRNWESYQVLRFTELPEVKIALINRPNEAPTGSGENAMTAIPRRGRECDLRRDRRTHAPAAVHACAREGGDRGAVVQEVERAAARPPSRSPGEAALGDGFLDEPAREREEEGVLRRVGGHRRVE